MVKRKVRGLTIRKDVGRASKYRLTFTYKGVLCRETLSLSVTAANTKYAERLLGEIHNKIERGTFRYSDYFPDSPKCALFGQSGTKDTVKDYLDRYIERCEKRGLSPSTITGYRKHAMAMDSLHRIRVKDLSAGDLKNWVTKCGTGLKTIRNRLSLLGSAVNEAVIDGAIDTNPVQAIRAGHYVPVTDRKGPDPFKPDEIQRILDACSWPQDKNLFQFAFHTGLRSSELIGLQWRNVDIANRIIRVDSAFIEGALRKTKTKGSTRVVELDDKAAEALQAQLYFTELGDFVFHNQRKDEPWQDDQQIRERAWQPILKKAGVRYRKPYNTRHTYATRHISTGANIWWLAQQMGHTSPAMLYQHYGTFIKEYEDANAQRKDLAGR